MDSSSCSIVWHITYIVVKIIIKNNIFFLCIYKLQRNPLTFINEYFRIRVTEEVKEMDKLLDARQAAEALHLSIFTIRSWRAMKKIQVTKIGRRVFFREVDLQTMIEKGIQAATN